MNRISRGLLEFASKSEKGAEPVDRGEVSNATTTATITTDHTRPARAS